MMFAVNDPYLDSESESDSEIDTLILLYSIAKKRKKSVWMNDYLKKRNTHGEFNLLEELNDGQVKMYFRLNKNQFDELHNLVINDITGHGCNAQQPIESELMLAVCLRYLATGDTFRSIGFSYRIGERTVSKIVTEVCKAIWKNMQPLYMPNPTIDMWRKVAEEFERKWQVYNCLGTIDGKHVTIKKQPKSGSSFFNYKQYCSIVLMDTVDANDKFTSIDIGSMGRFSDGNVFSNSGLGMKLSNGTLEIPPPKSLPGEEFDIPYVFVGDEAFPLTKNLMRPFPKRQVNNNYRNKVFNYR
ncbi:unnamed protein product [Acanthoscelides obtectus]|uniref:DDE Tnp4 domain-containing protein n=1 Tax=Acanthoscelides obtectus TaxID=200917 RepID=A0A9P0LPJ3_ACAOB|nr:unnamed protein product [Acanthoscelides obtectus]CAK1650226.1 Protein ANTAGONIST OF LIKE HETEROCHROMATIN PROTEIN 1 [Acanthoscelides obtectus]